VEKAIWQILGIQLINRTEYKVNMTFRTKEDAKRFMTLLNSTLQQVSERILNG